MPSTIEREMGPPVTRDAIRPTGVSVGCTYEGCTAVCPRPGERRESKDRQDHPPHPAVVPRCRRRGAALAGLQQPQRIHPIGPSRGGEPPAGLDFGWLSRSARRSTARGQAARARTSSRRMGSARSDEWDSRFRSLFSGVLDDISHRGDGNFVLRCHPLHR